MQWKLKFGTSSVGQVWVFFIIIESIFDKKKIKKDLVFYSFFNNFLMLVQSINFLKSHLTSSHKVCSHKFDKNQLSLANSHKPVMTFVSGQNIKFSF